jgi:hypothetical protein
MWKAFLIAMFLFQYWVTSHMGEGGVGGDTAFTLINAPSFAELSTMLEKILVYQSPSKSFGPNRFNRLDYPTRVVDPNTS